MFLLFLPFLFFLIRCFYDMSKVNAIEGLVSVRPKKRFGARYLYGCSVFGECAFGDDGVYGWFYGFGCGLFGAEVFGSDDELTGIYQTRHAAGRTFNERMGFYWPKNTYNAIRQANRTKFAAAVVAWQALTENQKALYNKDVIGLRMSGYNFFIRKYLLSF